MVLALGIASAVLFYLIRRRQSGAYRSYDTGSPFSDGFKEAYNSPTFLPRGPSGGGSGGAVAGGIPGIGAVNRNAAAGGSANDSMGPDFIQVDQRLNPVMVGERRISLGSLADAADYSRKVLRVANPDDN